MPLNIPESAVELVNRSKTDVKRELMQSEPFLANSWLGAIVTACANRVFDFYIQLQFALLQAFPNTATGSFLELWATVFGITRNAATGASGRIVATGIVTTSIPSGTVFASSDGFEYEATSSAVVANNTVNVSSVTRVGTVATVTTTTNHNLASNVPVTIAGANESEYNVVDAAVTVTGSDTFTYEVAGSPATPATGTITASFTAASVPVEALDFGAATNQDADATLTIQSPIAGLDSDAFVDNGTLSGGADRETDENLQDRTVDKIQNPVAHFNAAEITAVAKTVSGVTRVFVQEITPARGQVTVYFMQDNLVNPIPTAAEVAKVKSAISSIIPANTDPADVIVNAPTGVNVDFTFSALSPNTTTMKTAITNNLQQFFDEQAEIEEDILEDAYRSVIFNTIDVDTGDRVNSFTLSTPAGDITISAGEIGVLGTVAF